MSPVDAQPDGALAYWHALYPSHADNSELFPSPVARTATRLRCVKLRGAREGRRLAAQSTGSPHAVVTISIRGRVPGDWVATRVCLTCLWVSWDTKARHDAELEEPERTASRPPSWGAGCQ